MYQFEPITLTRFAWTDKPDVGGAGNLVDEGPAPSTHDLSIHHATWVFQHGDGCGFG